MPFKSTTSSPHNAQTGFILAFKVFSKAVFGIALLALICPALAFSSSISGTVTYNGQGLKDVDMKISGAASAEVTTDQNGSYIFSSLPDGNYRISLRKSPYAFSELSVTLAGSTNANFVATYRGCPREAMSGSGISISVPSGIFTSSFTVALSTTISGAEIRYTVRDYTTVIATSDTAYYNQTPTPSSSLYSGPINISNTARLSAAAFVSGTMRGYPSNALYVKMNPSFTATTHDLPVLIFDSYGSGALTTATNNRPYMNVAYLAFNTTAGGAITLSPAALPAPDQASLAAFHIHGFSSGLFFAKKPYKLELRDETGADRDCSVLGMPEDSDWILASPYTDKTLIHNNFVYELGRDMGMAAPRIKLAEVYVTTDNTGLSNAHYQGVYWIIESLKNSKNRTNLQQLHAVAPEDSVYPEITGGYIFNFDMGDKKSPGLLCPSGASNCWNDLFVNDPGDWPDADIHASFGPAYLTHPQYLYLQNFIKSFNDAINSANYTDPKIGYPAYIDEQSFIDTFIINELMRNGDAYTKSQYFYKERDKSGEPAKIFAGPLWDFDLTAGMGFGSGAADSTLATGYFQYTVMYNAGRFTGANGIGNWFPQLFNLISDKNSDFGKHLRTRWNTLRQPGGLLSDSAIDARIDALTAGLNNAATRNFTKWDILATKQVPAPYFNTPQTSTWPEQLTFMKNWLHTRAAWLDEQWLP